MKNALSLNRDTQERRGNGCSILTSAFILGVEQSFQFVLQIAGAAIFFGGFERVHRWSVVRPEFMDELGGRPAKVEGIGIPQERYLFLGHPCGSKSLDDVALDPPCHGADKALGWRRRIGCADFQYLRDQCWIVRDPI